MKKKVIRIGFDFDGVVAYNPFRVIRVIVSFAKSKIFGVKKLKFWYPTYCWQKWYWIVVHESSAYPAKGTDLLKKKVNAGEIEAHLITGRYSFLDHSLNRWLRRFKLNKVFKCINLNSDDEQPHVFKERRIKELKLDYYIEDNWDIVHYLDQKSKIPPTPRLRRASKDQKSGTKIFWIYNILDRGVEYPYKFPYLEKAIHEINKISKH
jgi:hypothetical protein